MTKGLRLSGNGNSETVIGTDYADTIRGLAGDDSLVGGEGNDVYVFNRGDGRDTISGANTLDNLNLGVDRIDLGEGIHREDILLEREGKT